MFTRKQFRGIAMFTLSIFICFTLTYEYSLAQEENHLLRAQDLYKQGNFIEAVKVLEAFIEKIKVNPNEKKRLAEANLLLARIYYEVGEDARVADYMKQAVAAYADIGKEEGNLDFKSRLEQVRAEWLKVQAKNKETTLVVPTEKVKAITSQPLVQEKEKPLPQLKKKKKFPWLLAILGVGVVVVLVALLSKKKTPVTPLVENRILTVTVGEGVAGNPGTGSYTYRKGDSVSYSYSLSSSNYFNLAVLLDGNKISESGSFSMDLDHTLSVSAIKKGAAFTNGVLTVNGVRYELASIPAGTFQMGSNSSEAFFDEQPVHTVRISKKFWMGKTEVTQGLWQAVMGSNPSNFKNGDNFPVEQVSWDDCKSFIQKLNQLLGGNAFRLPTEAEWEYSCRAGTTGERYGNLDAIAWYEGNAIGNTHPVGQKQPNAWGLFDMLGNVYEWCQDWWMGEYYHDSPTVDPTGPVNGSQRVKRGGAFFTAAQDVRSANRDSFHPGDRDGAIGFRLARTN